MFTKPGCHLCEEMKKDIQILRNEFNFNFSEVDINSDELLFDKYKDKIPVLEINGRMFAKFKIDENKLRSILSF
ncbi:MAG: glutaredoxin family protein [Ignavibacteria bacterium]|nr:glutaredoxin family protein [Ignavibacteria bacterium]